MNYSKIRGFNYQPSWGSTGLEIWRNFAGERMGHELALAKCYFPGINVIRLWLSHDAWSRNPKDFKTYFETALSIAQTHSLSVIPVLFNRWHDPVLDYGGIYIDHFLPNASWVQWKDQPSAFAESIFTAHATDSRIFAWDLCNEPFAYDCSPADIPDIVDAEYAWLKKMYKIGKHCKVQSPITVGIHAVYGLDGIRQIEPISDILSIHPYWVGDDRPSSKAEFEKLLDDYVQFAEDVNKPILATEACWGSTDDAKRIEIIRYSLNELKKRDVGWLAYLLHHSQVADAHRSEFGPIGGPGNLSFIEADGTLRPGHDVFNDF